MQLKTLQTKLETAPIDEISVILDNKVSQVGANGTADYIGLSLDNIDSSLQRIQEAVNELMSIKVDLKAQQDIIKSESAKWLQNNGIDKLQGDKVSSVSVYAKAETKNVIIEDEDEVIKQGFIKTSVDKTAVKNALLADQEVKGANIEIIHNEDSLKVNKRRK